VPWMHVCTYKMLLWFFFPFYLWHLSHRHYICEAVCIDRTHQARMSLRKRKLPEETAEHEFRELLDIRKKTPRELARINELASRVHQLHGPHALVEPPLHFILRQMTDPGINLRDPSDFKESMGYAIQIIRALNVSSLAEPYTFTTEDGVSITSTPLSVVLMHTQMARLSGHSSPNTRHTGMLFTELVWELGANPNADFMYHMPSGSYPRRSLFSWVLEVLAAEDAVKVIEETAMDIPRNFDSEYIRQHRLTEEHAHAFGSRPHMYHRLRQYPLPPFFRSAMQESYKQTL
jgi:hypothetical protein